MHPLLPSLSQGSNMLENYKIMLFQPRQPPFLSILSIVFSGSLLMSLKKSQFVGDEMRMRTCRRTELLQVLRVTTIDSHSYVGSQALGEVRHRLVDVFLW